MLADHHQDRTLQHAPRQENVLVPERIDIALLAAVPRMQVPCGKTLQAITQGRSQGANEQCYSKGDKFYDERVANSHEWRPCLQRSNFGPISAEHFHGGAGHVYVIVRFGPVQLQIAAAKVDDYAALRSAGESARHGHGARASSTGERLAGATLPHAHLYFLGPLD